MTQRICMKKYKLSLQAEEDLLKIFLTSLEQWGEKQAEKYANDLHECFNMLSEYPDMGMIREELTEKPKSFVKGEHIIFYRKVNNERIEIATILHQSMDIKRHIRDHSIKRNKSFVKT